MRLKFERLEFEIPSSTVLMGPMAAAKPLFAQKFIVKLLNGDSSYHVLYFATSSPVCGILRNLRIFGLKNEAREKITFFDYQPSCNGLKKVDANYYIGNFSDKKQLKEALSKADEKTLVIIPSFTLLLVGTEDKVGLAEVIINDLMKYKVTSFVAVNSAMFKDINGFLARNADNVLEFFKRDNKIYFKVMKFKGKTPNEEILFHFPKELFQSTKKEVAERTSRIIREKKVM